MWVLGILVTIQTGVIGVRVAINTGLGSRAHDEAFFHCPFQIEANTNEGKLMLLFRCKGVAGTLVDGKGYMSGRE